MSEPRRDEDVERLRAIAGAFQLGDTYYGGPADAVALTNIADRLVAAERDAEALRNAVHSLISLRRDMCRSGEKSEWFGHMCMLDASHTDEHECGCGYKWTTIRVRPASVSASPEVTDV